MDAGLVRTRGWAGVRMLDGAETARFRPELLSTSDHDQVLEGAFGLVFARLPRTGRTSTSDGWVDTSAHRTWPRHTARVQPDSVRLIGLFCTTPDRSLIIAADRVAAPEHN